MFQAAKEICPYQQPRLVTAKIDKKTPTANYIAFFLQKNSSLG